MDKMKLEVLLSLVNKATAPLRQITQASSSTAKALKAARDRIKELDQQQSQLNSWRKLSQDAASTKHQLDATQASIARLTQEIKASPAPTRAMTRELEKLKRQGAALKNEHTAQLQKQQALRASMAESGISTRNLNAYQKTLKADMAAATTEVEKQTRALELQGKAQQAMHAARAQYDKGINRRNQIAGAGAATMGAGAAMGLPILKIVKDFSTLEDARIGLAKQMDGAYDSSNRLTKEFFDMEARLMALSERLPLTTVEMYSLAEGAARMGIQGADNLTRFTEAAAIMQAAFDLPADEISMDMGKIADLYKIPIANIKELGDTINWLDDNAQSQGGDIIKVLQRVAGIATTAGMSYKDAAAFGSTFLSLGATEETAATATNAMIRELGVANMQSKRFQKGLEMVNLEAGQLQKNMAIDPTGTIIQVLEALKTLPQDKQLEAATRLFGKEYGDDASKLAQNIGELRRQLKLTHDEEARGSMQRESDRRNQSLSAQWEMTKNALFNTDASLGETLKPALVDFLVLVRELSTGIRNWTKEHPALTAMLMKTAAIVAILLVASGGLLLTVAAIMGPMLAFRLALAMLGIKGVTAAGAVTAIGRALAFLRVAAMAHPVLALITLLITAGVLIYKNWEPIKGFFIGIFDAIGAKFKTVMGPIMAGIKAVKEFFGSDTPAAGGVRVAGGPNVGHVRLRQRQVVRAPQASANNQTNHTSITVNAAPGMDEKQVAQAVERKLEEHQRRGLARRRSNLSDKD